MSLVLKTAQNSFTESRKLCQLSLSSTPAEPEWLQSSHFELCKQHQHLSFTHSRMHNHTHAQKNTHKWVVLPPCGFCKLCIQQRFTPHLQHKRLLANAGAGYKQCSGRIKNICRNIVLFSDSSKSHASPASVNTTVLRRATVNIPQNWAGASFSIKLFANSPSFCRTCCRLPNAGKCVAHWITSTLEEEEEGGVIVIIAMWQILPLYCTLWHISRP